MGKNKKKHSKKRKISKEKHLIAAILTVGIFLLGLFLGLLVDGERIDFLKSQSDAEKLDYSSMQLQYAFIDQLSQENNCPAVSKTFEQNINNLEDARMRLENYDEDAKLGKDDFIVLKREYTHAQIRYWLLAKKTKEICDAELSSILYFYANNELCPRCEDQAFILTYLKKRFKQKLMIFALDSDLVEEPLISILKDTYNLTFYPTLIIDDEKYEGFTEKDDILRVICPNFSDDIEDCEGFNEIKDEDIVEVTSE
jgi:hypothetical protein